MFRSGANEIGKGFLRRVFEACLKGLDGGFGDLAEISLVRSTDYTPRFLGVFDSEGVFD